MKNKYLCDFLFNLEKTKISYVLMRGWHDIPNSMSGGDLDLCVDAQDYNQIAKIIKEVQGQTGGVLVSFLDNLMMPKFVLLGMEWGIQIDVCLSDVQYHCINILPAGYVQANSVRYNDFNVLSEKADAYLAFLKEILNNGFCQKEKYVVNLRKELTKVSNEELYERLNVYSEETIQLFRQNVMDEDKKYYPELRKSLKRDILPTINMRYLRNQLMKWKRIFKHPGYIITVLGTDGSGKSAIIGAITPWLDEAFHNGVTYKHLRPGLLNDIAVVLGKRKADAPKQEVVENPHSGKQSGFIGSMLRLMYYLMDYMFGYLKLIWPQIVMHTKVFIFDRYYYDYYIDQRRSLINLPKWIIRLGEIFVPKPDVILCLGGDPEKIFARKPETSLEEVTRQTEELKRFAARRKNAVWIDTTQPIENSIHDAKSAILNMMSKRFKDVL